MNPGSSTVTKLNLVAPYKPYYKHNVEFTTTAEDIDSSGREMKCFWILMKIFLCNPVTVNPKTGERQCFFFSLNTLYFVVMYTALTYFVKINICTVTDGVSLLEGSMFEKTMFNYMWNMFHFVQAVPVLMMCEGRKIARYGNRWVSLQEKFYSVTGRPVVLQIKRMVRFYITMIISAVLCTPFILYMCLELMFKFTTKVGQTGSLGATVYIQQCYIFGLMTILITHWHLLTLAIQDVSNDILASLKERTQSKVQVSEREMGRYEQLWLELQYLVRETGTTFCCTIGFMLILLFVMTIIGTFMTLARLAVKIDWLSLLPITMIVPSFLAMIQITWCAYNVTKTVGENFRNAVQQLRFELTSEDTRLAADRFVHTITINPPIIDLNGFVVLNKEFGTSMLGTMVTYLVVLIQFQLTFNST